MKEMLLLGAGASKESEIPTAFEMTAKISELFRQSPHLRKHAEIISFVIGGLLFDKGIRGEDPLSCGINVEELFNAVDLLAQRNTLEASPFVGSWHAMVEELDRIDPPTPRLGRLHEIIFKSVTAEILKAFDASPPSFGANNIDRKLEETLKRAIEAAVKGRSFSSSFSASVGTEISNYVKELTKKWVDKLKFSHPSSYDFEREFEKAMDRAPSPAEGRVFRAVAEEMIQLLVNFVWIEQSESLERVKHLRPILSLLKQQGRLVIGTLNYDNTIEFLSSQCGVSCDVGIDEWSTAGSFDLQKEGLHLLKLHGSIDWALQRYRNALGRPMPHSLVKKIDPTEVKKGEFRPAVIFGQRNKLTVEGPFLDLLRAFRQELFNSELLTVIGYSFGDAHVNEYISQWLNQASAHQLRVINRSFEHIKQPYIEELKQMQAKSPNRVTVIAKTAGEGLQELYGTINSPTDTPLSSAAVAS